MQAPNELPHPPPLSGKKTPSRRRNEELFTRWLLMVYLPLGLLCAGIILLMLGVLPRGMAPGLVVLAAWGLVAIRLLWERRRLGLEVPPPRSMVIGIGSIGVMALAGAILTWVGLDRLASTSGVVMLYSGGVLMLTALFAPAFKLLDLAIRAVARRVLREAPVHDSGPAIR